MEVNIPKKSNIINSEVSIKDLITSINKWFGLVLAKWKVIFIISFLGGLLGAGYAFLQKPIYIAQTTFVLEEESNSSGMLSQLGGIASLAGIDAGVAGAGGLFQGDNILELYKSRTMIQKTLLSKISIANDSLLLVDYYISKTGLKNELKKNNKLRSLKFGYEDKSSERMRDSVLRIIVEKINKENLIVSRPNKKLSIVEITVNSNDEIFSKTFNDLLVKNVNDFYVSTKTKKSSENLAIIQHQTDSVRQILTGAIYTTAQIADATPNLNPTRMVLRAPGQQSQLNAQANTTILTQLVQNLELAKLSLRQETPLIQLIDYPIFPLRKQETSVVLYFVGFFILFLFLTTFYLTFLYSIKKIISNNLESKTSAE